MIDRIEWMATNGGMPITSSATVCVRRWGGRGSCRAVFPRIGFVFTLLLADGTRSVPATITGGNLGLTPAADLDRRRTRQSLVERRFANPVEFGSAKSCQSKGPSC